MTSEASTTTWETLVEQYRERAARDDARIEELRQRTEHWHDTAQILKRQRGMAEEERDEWKIRAMASEQQRQALQAERDALHAALGVQP
jgi:chromosome segregation ATPase